MKIMTWDEIGSMAYKIKYVGFMIHVIRDMRYG
jgi:hypothetical protein